jgi:hypothetical protein
VRVPLRPHVAGWVSLVEPGGKEILRQVGAPAAAEPKGEETTNEKDGEKELMKMPELPAVGSKFKVIVPVVVARKSELSTSSQTGNLQRGTQVCNFFVMLDFGKKSPVELINSHGMQERLSQCLRPHLA